MKFELEVEENISYIHKIEIKTESLNEDDLNSVLTEIETNENPSSLDDYIYKLQLRGINVTSKSIDQDGSSGDYIECTEIKEI